MRAGRVPREDIEKLVGEIARQFKPDRIVLFGSHANGTATADSDVDLLVVMPTPKRCMDQAIEIRRALSHTFGLDLLVRTPQQVEERVAQGDFFLTEILATGAVLYERAHARMAGES